MRTFILIFNKWKFIFLLVIFLSLTKLTKAVAFNDTIQIHRYDSLQEIVVNTTFFEQKIKQIPGNIGLITEAQLKDNDINIVSSLNATSGIFVQSGTLNTNRITVRGIGSRTPYSTNRIQAYLNDFPITDGNGITIIEDIDPEYLQRVEIIKGPNSALFGNNLAGVIALKTNPRLQKNKFYLSAGSFGQLKMGISSGLELGNNTTLNATATHLKTDGFRQNNEYRRTSGMANLKHWGNGLELQALLMYTDLKAQIPSSINFDSFMQNPEQAAQNWLNIKGFEEYQKLFSGISIQNKLSEKSSIKGVLSFVYQNSYESRPFNILDDDLKSIYALANYHFKGKSIENHSGLTFRVEDYHFETIETIEGLEGETINDFTHRNYTFNAFSNFRIPIKKKHSIEAAINVNRTHYQLRELTDNSPLKHSYPVIIAPRAGYNFSLSKNVNTYGALGYGFSNPSYEEALLPEGEYNQNLKQEKGWMTELGVRGKMGQDVTFDAGLYLIQLNNLLITERLSEDTFMGINAGKTSHKGIEIGIKWYPKLNDRAARQPLLVSASYNRSINRFEDFVNNGISYNGNQLPGIPRSIFTGIIEWNPVKRLSTSVKIQQVGEQFMNDQNSETYGSYAVIDWRITYGIIIGKNLLLSSHINMNNLTNTHYASMILINAKSFGGDAPRYYYPGAPRNINIGLSLAF